MFSALLVNQFGGTYVSCAAGLSPQLVGLLQSLLPNTALMRSAAVKSILTHPGDDCVLNLSAILDYYGSTSPVWVYGLVLLLYLLIVHALTLCGLLSLARKERR
jgi:hypothetical protein